MVAEGIETALSLASGLLDAPATVWAALSTCGMRGLRLPPAPGRLTIASDGDDAGRAAAQALATRAHGLGWQVELLPAPEGCDWNDVLTRRRRGRGMKLATDPIHARGAAAALAGGARRRNPTPCTRSGRCARPWRRCKA